MASRPGRVDPCPKSLQSRVLYFAQSIAHAVHSDRHAYTVPYDDHTTSQASQAKSNTMSPNVPRSYALEVPSNAHLDHSKSFLPPSHSPPSQWTSWDRS